MSSTDISVAKRINHRLRVKIPFKQIRNNIWFVSQSNAGFNLVNILMISSAHFPGIQMKDEQNIHTLSSILYTHEKLGHALRNYYSYEMQCSP